MRILIVSLLAGVGAVSCGTGPVKTEHERRLDQVIYDDCMPVHVNEFRLEGKDNPEFVAHYVCKVISGICRETTNVQECKKGIAGYDRNRNNSGPSELYKAAELGNANLVTQLLEIGFDPNAQLGSPGWTPLMIASANGHQKAVFSLLLYGSDVNATNDKGRTALMFASSHGYDSIVKALLEKGANPNLIPKDEPRWPALIAASFKGHSKTVAILLKHGADVKIEDESGMTAYSWAEKEGRKNVLQVFQQKGITH